MVLGRKRMGLFIASIVLVFVARLPLAVANGDVVRVAPFDISGADLANYLGLGGKNLSFPTLYVFGDSYLDSPNNNDFDGKHRFNYPP